MQLPLGSLSQRTVHGAHIAAVRADVMDLEILEDGVPAHVRQTSEVRHGARVVVPAQTHRVARRIEDLAVRDLAVRRRPQHDAVLHGQHPYLANVVHLAVGDQDPLVAAVGVVAALELVLQEDRTTHGVFDPAIADRAVAYLLPTGNGVRPHVAEVARFDGHVIDVSQGDCRVLDEAPLPVHVLKRRARRTQVMGVCCWDRRP